MRIIMADFIFSLNATLPIFLIMVLGWFLMRIGLFTKAAAVVKALEAAQSIDE